METVRVGIVGVGPRGLTLLERIVAHERQRKSAALDIFVFDPQGPGCGCHAPEQPDFHLVNTVAGQLTLFADASVIGAGPVMNGPSFHQWLADQARMGTCKPLAGVKISPDAYYSRALFGRYLMWVFRYVCAMAPAHVRIHLRQTSVDGAKQDGHGAWLLHTADASVRVDYLFLTTGHTKPAKAPERGQAPQARQPCSTQVVDDPYPMKAMLASITAGQSVAVEGMGLTAFDVLAELTVGRGGHFRTDPDTGKTLYIKSGREPQILMLSRSGLPLSARAVNQKSVSGQYRASFLKIAHLRELRVCRQLDFAKDVLPLLTADMELAYCNAYLRERLGRAEADQFCDRFAVADAHERQALVGRHVAPEHRFSWQALAQPVPGHALRTREAFKAWLMDHLRCDVQEAHKGNLDSPLKAACDVLRDLRDNLRAAIEFGGLTPASHQWVMSTFMPIMNRLAVGPPAARISEMLALMEAGVLEADFGPGAVCRPSDTGGLMHVSAATWNHHPRPVHCLVRARISMHSPSDDASPLLQGLLRDGHVRLYRNGGFHPGGIEIDRDHHWVSRDGRIVDNAWSLGIPTEGIKFCTFVVPRPGVNSTAMVDAGRAAASLLQAISLHQAALTDDPVPDLPSDEQAMASASIFGAL